jgi:hypothetical protein
MYIRDMMRATPPIQRFGGTVRALDGECKSLGPLGSGVSHDCDHTIYVNQREPPPPEDMKFR